VKRSKTSHANRCAPGGQWPTLILAPSALKAAGGQNVNKEELGSDSKRRIEKKNWGQEELGSDSN
jgi:hypothetical protein